MQCGSSNHFSCDSGWELKHGKCWNLFMSQERLQVSEVPNESSLVGAKAQKEHVNARRGTAQGSSARWSTRQWGYLL
jgi:hypothetical protein